MPSVFDLHVVTALRERWDELEGDLPLFKLHFQDEALTDAMLTEWHTELVAKGIEIRLGWTLGPPDDGKSIVGVTYDDEPLDTQLLGDYGRTEGQDEVLTMVSRQTVTVRSWAHHPELNRALRVLVRNMLMVATGWFASLGYGEVVYMGGGDLRPEEALTPEELGTWIQSQRWAAVGESSVTVQGAVDHKDVLTAAEDMVVDGYQGGVSPWEQ
jgi:hypothetical protein